MTKTVAYHSTPVVGPPQGLALPSMLDSWRRRHTETASWGAPRLGGAKVPEAPDLEVVREYLTARTVGVEISTASVIKPSVLRSLAGDFASDIAGRTIAGIDRRGKFLMFRLSGDRLLVVNPMLTGAFQYCAPKERVFKRTCLTLSLSDGNDVRYLDDRQMGRLYYAAPDQLGDIPGLEEQGPDVLDDFSFDEFRDRLRAFHGLRAFHRLWAFHHRPVSLSSSGRRRALRPTGRRHRRRRHS